MNTHLQRAKDFVNDEFYTVRDDVEREMEHYKQFFREKTIYLPCDENEFSEFYNYFSDNFDALELKKLICTYHVPFFSGYRPQCTIHTKDGKTVYKLAGNGDFRSDECLKFFDESDIIITNPPFSLFREFFPLIICRKFIIITSVSSLSYTSTMPHIKDFWCGVTKLSIFRQFDNSTARVNNCLWITNLPHGKITNSLPNLSKRYTKEEYPVYDQYDAINVDKLADIPIDYYGKMGVPCTIFRKHWRDEFDLIGKDSTLLKEKWGNSRGCFSINGKSKFKRIVIQRRKI